MDLPALPEHFWDGAGGAIIGGLLAFGAAMVVLFATRAHDQRRMRLDIALQSARNLTPHVSQIEADAERLWESPSDSVLFDALHARLEEHAPDLHAFSYEVPRDYHPQMSRNELFTVSDSAFWLGVEALPLLDRALDPEKDETVEAAAAAIVEVAGEMDLAYFRSLAPLPFRDRMQKRYWRLRRRLRRKAKPTPEPTQPPPPRDVDAHVDAADGPPGG